MVTVSNSVNSQMNRPAYQSSFTSTAKAYIDKNFQSNNSDSKKADNRKYKEDTLLENTFANRMRINLNKTLDIPLVHFPRGLGGAPDYTFFEFLQTAKFPYYIGGPILAALFYAGVKKDNFKSAEAAQRVAKHMALGVGLYYVGAAVAKSIINNTVKLSRGMDLKHPYAKAISTTTNHTGAFKKDVEYHTVFESADFTRTDLLYNKKGTNPKEINETYARYGKKYGVNTETNDVDQTVKPLMKKTIIMARAWQYALTAFFVTLGIGMANQKAWDNTSAYGFKETLKKGVFGRNIKDKAAQQGEFVSKLSAKDRINNLKVAVYDYILQPFGQSFVQFWKGHNKASSIAGKTVILSTALATATAIGLITHKTSARKHKVEVSGTNSFDEGQK